MSGLGFPWVAAAAIAASTGSSVLPLWFNRRAPGQKVDTTLIVNETEPILIRNLAEFQAGRISRQAALDVFDQAWAYIRAACGDAAMGNPGRACIRDRQAGGRWDWFAAYRTPIETAPDPAAEMILPAGGAAGGLLIPAALIAAALML